MPTPTLFLVFSFLLRMVEGVGTGMFTTVSYTILTQLYPDKKGTVIVSEATAPSLIPLLSPNLFKVTLDEYRDITLSTTCKMIVSTTRPAV